MNFEPFDRFLEPEQPRVPVAGTENRRGPLQPCDVVIYSIPWAVDSEARDGEWSNARVRCRVTVNGVEVPGLLSADTHADVAFSEVMLRLQPSAIEHRAIPSEEFYAAELPSEVTR